MGTREATNERRRRVLVVEGPGAADLEATIREAGFETFRASPGELRLRIMDDVEVAVVSEAARGIVGILEELLECNARTIVAGQDLTSDRVLAIGRAGADALWNPRSETFAKVLSDALRAPSESASGIHRVNDRFRRLLRSVPAAVWEVDLSAARAQLANVYSGNHDLDAAFVAAAERVVGRAMNDEAEGFGAEAFPIVGEALLRSWLSGDRVPRVEVTMQRQQRDRTLLISASMPTGGALDHIVVVGLDVTEQRELARALLAAQRLEAVGRLAAGIAHDFNNVLTVLGSYAGFLADDLPADSASHEDVEVMQDAIRRAAGLVSQLLAFSRRQQQRLERLDLNDEVRNTERLLRRTLGEDIEVRVQLCPDDLLVHADRAQLDQVLMNLAVNARDAMPHGGVLRLSTALRRQSDSWAHPQGFRIPAGDYAALLVEDTGTGMTPEVLAHVFEPFFTTKAERGSGLGLATVYGIIKQHGGFVTLRSEPGSGTSFEILLPRSVSGSIHRGRVQRPSQPVQAAIQVLLVEDNEEVRRALTRVLEGHGFTVRATSDVDEALRWASDAEIRFDVLLSDVVMPRLNGVVLAERIRRARPEIGVVLTSGHGEHAALADAFGDERAVFVQKPLGPERLLEAILASLAKGERAEE
ncbi:MAG: response regulator [Myxococcales bacterium]|nr:response regulator [Myxococcales bacterium]